MSKKVSVDDVAVRTTIEAVAVKAAEVEALGLELGKVVVPIISLNKDDLLFVEYNEYEEVAAGEFMTPPAGVIAMVVSHAGDAGDLEMYVSTFLVRETTSFGMTGCIYCDGTHVKFKNTNAGAKNITVMGIRLVL